MLRRYRLWFKIEEVLLEMLPPFSLKLLKSKYLLKHKLIRNDLCCNQQRLRKEEEERQKEYERLLLTQAKAGILMEREIERKRKQQEQDQALENQRLAAEQKAQ